MSEQKPFDARLTEKYKVGDLVSWSNDLIGEKQFGFIQRIYIHEIDQGAVGREFMFARIKKSNGETENFMLSALTLESKNK
ncbi:MAG TPA: hypothetical protein EYO58_10895 [Flavobacteriales bacterium]|nr:hypothetical protein [Flavobacteriales bacterium]